MDLYGNERPEDSDSEYKSSDEEDQISCGEIFEPANPVRISDILRLLFADYY